MKKATKYFTFAITIYFSVMLVLTFIKNQESTDKESEVVVNNNVSHYDNSLSESQNKALPKHTVEIAPGETQTPSESETESETETEDEADKTGGSTWDFDKDKVPLPYSAYESQTSNVLSCMKKILPWNWFK